MTDTSIQDLSRTKLRRLLAAVGSAPAEEAAPPEAVEYDWRDPHFFSEEQRNELAAAMSHVAALMGEKFVHFFNQEFSVAPTSITQHFAADLCGDADFGSMRCLTFGAQSAPPCGFLATTRTAASQWARRLLGDADADGDTERPLSALEESLLHDLTHSLVEAFLTPLQAHQALGPGDAVSQDVPETRFEMTEPVCRIAFDVKADDDAEVKEVYVVSSCRILAPSVGKELKASTSVAPADLSKMLTEHLYQMPVTVVARLDSTLLNFRELVDLNVDDILLFDKTIAEPVELMVEERVVSRGRAAQSDGQYAVWITEATNTSEWRQPAVASHNQQKKG
jgi:flagellar motor switch protein FliM